MKLLVISDTHGHYDKVVSLLEDKKDFDMLVHLGDYESDAERIAAECGMDFISVPGNCDGCFNKKEGEKVLQTEYGPILLTHGHLRRANSGDRALFYAAKEHECKAVFFGHTHRSFLEEGDGMTMLNPGSVAHSRDGNPPSYAIVHTSEERLECAILFFKEGAGGKTKEGTGKKAAPGKLRGMLNYSDRF